MTVALGPRGAAAPRVRRDALLMSVTQAIGAVAGVTMSITAARVLSKDGVALLSWILTASAFLGVLGTVGAPQAVVARLGRTGDADRPRVFRAFMACTGAGVLVAIAVWAVVGPFAARWSGSRLYDSGIVAVAVLVPTVAFAQLIEAGARSIGHFPLAALCGDHVRKIVITAILATGSITATTIDVSQLVLLVPVVEVLILGTYLLRLARHGVPVRGPVSAPDTLRSIRCGLGFLPIALVAMTVPQLGVWLGALTMSPDAVAELSVAVRLSFAVNLPLVVLGRVMAPRIAVATDLRELVPQLRAVAGVAAMFTSAATVALVVFGPTLIGATFGHPYRAATVPLVVLNLGQVVSAFTGLCGLCLSNSGHQRVVARVATRTACAYVVLAIAMSALWGAIGIAAASALCIAGSNVVFWAAARGTLGIDTSSSLVAVRTAVGGWR